MRSPGAEQRDPGGAEVYLRRLHYDLAGSPSPYSLASLLQLGAVLAGAMLDAALS